MSEINTGKQNKINEAKTVEHIKYESILCQLVF